MLRATGLTDRQSEAGSVSGGGASEQHRVEDMTAELGAELEESVALAAEQGCSEQQLADKLTEQLHQTVALAADAARQELMQSVQRAVGAG